MRRHPTEPDRNDARRALADRIWKDQVATVRRGQSIALQNGLLFFLGYRRWMLPGRGFTSPDTSVRRPRVLAKAREKPYYDDLVATLNDLGYARPPDRDCEKRFEYLKRFCRVSRDTVEWGLEDTQERDLVFDCLYDRLRLRILDGDRVVHERVRGSFDNSLSLASFGADDNDYRFEVSCIHTKHGSRASTPFDYAKIDGEWERLEFQGHEWDGEWGDPDPEPAAAAPPAREPLPLSTKAWLESRVRRYGSGRTGEHWRAIKEATEA